MACFLPVDEGKLLKDLNHNFMVKRHLGMISGGLNLKYGRYMAIANAVFLTVKNVEVPMADEKEFDIICEETD